MMPQTVPNSPMKGAAEPVLARKVRRFSSRSISRPMVTPMARSTRSFVPATIMAPEPPSVERRHSRMPALNTAASGWVGCSPSRRNNSSKEPPDQKRSSKASASARALRSATNFSKAMAQT